MSLEFNGRATHPAWHVLLVADLADIITSKRAAGRPRDRAVLDALEKTLDETKKIEKGKA